MSVIYLGGLAISGFLLSSHASARTIKWATEKGFLDIPNVRSSHFTPTPIGGGIAIMGSTLGLWLAYLALSRLLDPQFLIYAGAGLFLGMVGWVDDIRSVKKRIRFLVQALAAVAAIWTFGYYHEMALPFLGVVPLSWLGAPLTFLWIIGLINAFNFMDGIDMMAGGQGVVAGLGWIILGSVLHHPEIGVLGLLVASSSLGFLVHNRPPAKILSWEMWEVVFSAIRLRSFP